MREEPEPYCLCLHVDLNLDVGPRRRRAHVLLQQRVARIYELVSF